ncbi:hypothetical protein ACWCZ5_32080 [Streptomyces sp. NPDC001667]
MLILHDAQRWPTGALESLCGTWKAALSGTFAAVLTGPDRLRTVLERPRLASLRSCILTHYRCGQ